MCLNNADSYLVLMQYIDDSFRAMFLSAVIFEVHLENQREKFKPVPILFLYMYNSLNNALLVGGPHFENCTSTNTGVGVSIIHPAILSRISLSFQTFFQCTLNEKKTDVRTLCIKMS